MGSSGYGLVVFVSSKKRLLKDAKRQSELTDHKIASCVMDTDSSCFFTSENDSIHLADYQTYLIFWEPILVYIYFKFVMHLLATRHIFLYVFVVSRMT